MTPRVTWSSSSAESVWGPRLEAIHETWQKVEWLSVLAGLRACAVVHVDPEALPNLAGRLARSAVMAIPLDQQAAGDGVFNHRLQAARVGAAFRYRVLIGRALDVMRFQDALQDCNDALAGALLGYPSCCTEAFVRRWQEERTTDPVWQMALAANGVRRSDDRVEVLSAPEANVLCRYLGIRLVPHLPCSLTCEATIRLAAGFFDVARVAGMGSEMKWAETVLDWPCEWSAVHGLAELKLPVLKCVNGTDQSDVKRVVRLIGRTYPDEGAQGLTFPFRRPARPGPTERPAFRRGAELLSRRSSLEKSESGATRMGIAASGTREEASSD